MLTFSQAVLSNLFGVSALAETCTVPGLKFGKLQLLIFPFSALFHVCGSFGLPFLTYPTFHALFVFCAIPRTASASRAKVYRSREVLVPNLETQAFIIILAICMGSDHSRLRHP
jgi:hypothetical protein